MSFTTISPQARIGALLGVLLIVLTGSAIFFMHGHSQSATVAPPTVQPQPAPGKPVHVARPAVNPLLPAPIRLALEYSPLVVAGFYNPHSPVDMQTIEEARAGAASTHVLFRSVNLLNDAVAGPLTALLPAGELLPSPGFVIYRRPGTLVYRSDGYLNRTSVAQAIKDTR
jgi:hypothetical protein